jgi:hypothetical protein
MAWFSVKSNSRRVTAADVLRSSEGGTNASSDSCPAMLSARPRPATDRPPGESTMNASQSGFCEVEASELKVVDGGGFSTQDAINAGILGGVAIGASFVAPMPGMALLGAGMLYHLANEMFP